MERDQRVENRTYSLQALALFGAVGVVMHMHGYQYVPHGGQLVVVAMEQLEKNVELIGKVPLAQDYNDIETISRIAAKYCEGGGVLRLVPSELQDVFQGFQRG